MHGAVTPTAGEGWFRDDRKKKETQLLTSANDKLSVSAKSVLNLWCEVDLSCLVVRRCSEITKNTLQMSAIECIQSWDHCRLIRRDFQSTGDRKEGGELTDAPGKITQPRLYPMFLR